MVPFMRQLAHGDNVARYHQTPLQRFCFIPVFTTGSVGTLWFQRLDEIFRTFVNTRCDQTLKFFISIWNTSGTLWQRNTQQTDTSWSNATIVNREETRIQRWWATMGSNVWKCIQGYVENVLLCQLKMTLKTLKKWLKYSYFMTHLLLISFL